MTGGNIVPALLDDEAAAAYLGVGVRRFAELRDETWMPPAIVLAPRIFRWARSELDAAIASMPRQQGKSEPLQLAKARAARAGRTEVVS